jgi:hypothetical protein
VIPSLRASPNLILSQARYLLEELPLYHQHHERDCVQLEWRQLGEEHESDG